ncbi:MAG: endonuclease [Bacteroidales bacterium]
MSEKPDALNAGQLQNRFVFFTALLLLLAGISAFGQPGRYRVVFYNVENLWDTFDDPEKQDEEFLPEGERRWNDTKMYRKLENIAKVIIGAGGWEPPVAVGLCEVENRYVLDQLTGRTALSRIGYSVIHFESPDKRGIDVALLYRPGLFKPDTAFPVRITFPFDSGSFTRDILYVKGRVAGSPTIHIFVNHWPSRYGGYMETRPKRAVAAQTLRHMTDSLLSVDSLCRILIMGDLNDTPQDESVAAILGVKPWPDFSANNLTGLISAGTGFPGTIRSGAGWMVFDQIIISKGLADTTSLFYADPSSAMIYHEEFLLQPDERFGGVKPFRTYSGFRYLGGFSDHLPVMVDLILK